MSRKIIIAFIAGLLLCFICDRIMFNFGNCHNQSDGINQRYIDSIAKTYDVKIKQKEETISFLMKQEALFKDSIAVYYVKLQNNSVQIEKIKKETNEKIIKVNTLSTNDLALFFTTRQYGKNENQ